MHKKATIKDVLLAWMEERDVSANALARATGVPQPTISRILKGESKDPDTATLQPIAAWFGRTVSALRGETVLDATLQQPTGTYASPPGTAIARLVPIISWDHAGQARGAMQGSRPDSTECFPCPIECSEDTFALRVEGISMEPKFRAGEIVFVDPRAAPTPDCFVVVQLGGDPLPKLKRYVIEGGQAVIQSLNPQWPEPIARVDHNVRVIGIVVFKGEML